MMFSLLCNDDDFVDKRKTQKSPLNVFLQIIFFIFSFLLFRLFFFFRFFFFAFAFVCFGYFIFCWKFPKYLSLERNNRYDECNRNRFQVNIIFSFWSVRFRLKSVAITLCPNRQVQKWLIHV